MPVLGEGRRSLHTFAICHGVGEAEHVSAHPIGSVVLAVSPTRMKNMDAHACHHSDLIHILSVAHGQIRRDRTVRSLARAGRLPICCQSVAASRWGSCNAETIAAAGRRIFAQPAVRKVRALLDVIATVLGQFSKVEEMPPTHRSNVSGNVRRLHGFWHGTGDRHLSFYETRTTSARRVWVGEEQRPGRVESVARCLLIPLSVRCTFPRRAFATLRRTKVHRRAAPAPVLALPRRPRDPRPNRQHSRSSRGCCI